MTSRYREPSSISEASIAHTRGQHSVAAQLPTERFPTNPAIRFHRHNQQVNARASRTEEEPASGRGDSR